MTSLEITEVAGKQHCDVVRPIRKMEEAWKEVTQGNFSLSTYQEGYPKHGACIGKSTWAQICADVPRGKNRQQCRPPALGYSKPLNAISMHVDEDDKTTTLIQGTGSNYMLPN